MTKPLTTNPKRIHGWGIFLSHSIIFVIFLIFTGFTKSNQPTKTPVYVAIVWQFHQPVYWPYESINATIENNRYNFPLREIFDQYQTIYTNGIPALLQKNLTAVWPHYGIQISMSGSLIENLNNLESNGDKNFRRWKSKWQMVRPQKTGDANPRFDFVGTAYFQPSLFQINPAGLHHQIDKQKKIMRENFPGTSSKGFFPTDYEIPERFIPVLADEGYQWVLVNQLSLERAAQGYRYNPESDRIMPNLADIQNKDPLDWVSLDNRQPQNRISALWAHQPHNLEYTDPGTGISSSIIAVPTIALSLNETGTLPIDTLNLDKIINQLQPYNIDSKHPIIFVLSLNEKTLSKIRDENIQIILNWLKSNDHKVRLTTIQDYLDRYPPDKNDLAYITNPAGSELARNSLSTQTSITSTSDSLNQDKEDIAVLTAARNFVATADQVSPYSKNTIQAWNLLMAGQTSDYQTLNSLNTDIWTANPVRAANKAISLAQKIITQGKDETAPSIFTPQRVPYNPGITETGSSQSGDFQIWTFAYDIHGLKNVSLYYRTETDTSNTINKAAKLTYNSYGDSWKTADMSDQALKYQSNPAPDYLAHLFSTNVTGIRHAFIDYYVEATDSLGNTSRTSIQRVWVAGDIQENKIATINRTPIITILPKNPTRNDTIEIRIQNVTRPASLRWGVNEQKGIWQKPAKSYIPEGSIFNDGKQPSISTPFSQINYTGETTVKIGPFNHSGQQVNQIDFGIQYQTGATDSLPQKIYHLYFADKSGISNPYIMDGKLDKSAHSVAGDNGSHLYLDSNGRYLYLATESAANRNDDIVIFINDSLKTDVNAPFSKEGKVAGWSAFLVNKDSANTCNWVDNHGYVSSLAGDDLLEGTIDLQAQFGTIPTHIYVAVAAYQPKNGGKLVAQIPDGNGDRDIQSYELYRYDYINEVTSTQAGAPKPDKYLLQQNYPNPFNPATRISYTIPKQVRVTLSVYNLLGQKVATVIDKYQVAGEYNVIFDASNLTSGVYFYRLKAGDYIETRSMTVLK